MANPATKKGHVRIANDLWLAMMKTGPYKERVYKAVIWECWGFEDRREAKESVSITRGRFAELTGITHKSTISAILNELATEKRIEKHSKGGLKTPSYWPIQDYESWVGEDTASDIKKPRRIITPRPENTPTPRPENTPTPRPENTPINDQTPYYSTSMVQTVQEGEGSSSSKTPAFTIYEKALKQRNQNLSPELADAFTYVVEDYGEDVVRDALVIALGSPADKATGNLITFIKMVAPSIKARIEREAAEAANKPRVVVLDEEGTDIAYYDRLAREQSERKERDRLREEERAKNPPKKIDMRGMLAAEIKKTQEQKKEVA